MGQPAARLTDMHSCPMVTGLVPHIGGPIVSPGCPTVLIGGLPAARVTDMATCVGPPDMILQGARTVLIGGLPAARIGDPTVHGGAIVLGCLTVLIGDDAGDGYGTETATSTNGESSDDSGTLSPWDILGDMLSSGGALSAPLQQARAQVVAARSGTPFCQRCVMGG